MDIELPSHSKITFSSSLVVHTCSLHTDVRKEREQPADSRSTTATEVFSIGVAVIGISLENSSLSKSLQNHISVSTLNAFGQIQVWSHGDSFTVHRERNVLKKLRSSKLDLQKLI